MAADGSPPLDGLDAWPSIAAGQRSNRTEMLLWLNTHQTPVPDGAVRVGKYKLIQKNGAGKAGMPHTHSDIVCTPRDGQQTPLGPTVPGPHPKDGSFPYPITNVTSMAWCPSGWVPPPESGAMPKPPPGVPCPGGPPCVFANTSYATGGTWLFDIEADPTETTDLSGQHPEVVAQLRARLDYFVNLSIPQDHGSFDPNSNPSRFGGVWTPWLGDSNPAKCAWPPPPPPPGPPGPPGPPPGPPGPPGPPAQTCGGDGAVGDAELHVYNNSKGKIGCAFSGWCSGTGFSGPPRAVNLTIDGVVVAHDIANGHRTVAGEHGFVLDFGCGDIATGKHTVAAACKCPGGQGWQPVTSSGKAPACTDGPPVHEVPCPGLVML